MVRVGFAFCCVGPTNQLIAGALGECVIARTAARLMVLRGAQFTVACVGSVARSESQVIA
jgi:hypothetical protein